jgi:hypothetical protein
VEKMIMAEEKMKERFPDRNNRENNRDNSDRRKFPNMGHSDRKRGPDNTIFMADKMKKFSRFRTFEDIKNMHCIWGNRTVQIIRAQVQKQVPKYSNFQT